MKNLVPSGNCEAGGTCAPHWLSTYVSPTIELVTTCVAWRGLAGREEGWGGGA